MHINKSDRTMSTAPPHHQTGWSQVCLARVNVSSDMVHTSFYVSRAWRAGRLLAQNSIGNAQNQTSGPAQ